MSASTDEQLFTEWEDIEARNYARTLRVAAMTPRAAQAAVERFRSGFQYALAQGGEERIEQDRARAREVIERESAAPAERQAAARARLITAGLPLSKPCDDVSRAGQRVHVTDYFEDLPVGPRDGRPVEARP